MKKYLLVLFSFLLLVGCSEKKNALKSMDNKISKTKSYHLVGVLTINRGDDKYTYDVDCSYQNNDYYRVSLTNTINQHEQIILRNDEGVFVLNPSLNKSFKFESDWPYNNSQIYLLQVILSDIKNDNKYEIKSTKNGYVFKSKVNYLNNSDLVYQKVYVDKKYNVTMVEVYDANNNLEMKMEFTNIDYNNKYDNNYFSLDDNNKPKELEKTNNKIEDIVYPMYLPTNTYLTAQETVKTSDGERAILTFSGDNSFMLVEETLNIPDTLETYMVYGEPDIILDTVGSITDYSVSWISNGVEYYLVSNDMSSDELVNVAGSINVIPVGK